MRMKRMTIAALLLGLATAVSAQAQDAKAIHTLDGFRDFLETRQGVASKITSKCSPDEVKALTKSLVFRNGKLSGMNIKDLKGRLTKADFEQLWSAFGVNPKTVLHDYICIEQERVCRQREGYVCIAETCQ